eukprot:TRINITY_DN9180_c0_g1_i1.p1 TRINITY_DN9180_c0_g1~~TRINITY_DN9180_c0_g1_i1.p1  ORF type:complete len:325 (+),score=77.39 TRINITY_DN9180_c0_g1_i1:227-1201(+)
MSLPFWNEKLFQDMIKEVQERKKSEVDKIEFLIDQKFDELVFQAEEMINNLRTRVKDSLRDLRAAEDYLVKVISENVTTEELSSLFEKNKPNFSEMVKNILAKLEAAPEIEANAKTAKSIKGHLWALVEDDGMKDIAQKLEKVLNSTQLGKRFNPQHRPFLSIQWPNKTNIIRMEEAHSGKRKVVSTNKLEPPFSIAFQVENFKSDIQIGVMEKEISDVKGTGWPAPAAYLAFTENNIIDDFLQFPNGKIDKKKNFQLKSKFLGFISVNSEREAIFKVDKELVCKARLPDDMSLHFYFSIYSAETEISILEAYADGDGFETEES